MDLAQTLKDFRRDNGLEQDELAKLLETTQQTVSNWESGTMPRSAALNRINHLLKTYKKGEAPSPWVRPTYHPAITEIHEIPVDEEVQRKRLDSLREQRNAQAHGQVMDEKETRMYVAQSLNRIIERPATDTGFVHRFRAALFAALPPEIEYERDAMVRFQGVQTRADYLSDKVCAEIKGSSHPSNSPIFDLGIHQLNTIREIHRRLDELRPIYLLIVAATETSMPGRTNRLLNLAALHDIQIFVATTPEEAAGLIIGLELGSSAEDDFIDF